MINFAEALKADLSSVETEGPRKPIPPGSYDALITGVEQKKYSTGALGMKLTFKITSEGEFEGRDLYENIVMVKSDGTVIEFNGARLKRRLLAAGFSADQILKFKHPKSDKDLGDFAKMLGRPVRVTVETEIIEKGKAAGKPSAAVKRVDPVPTEEAAATA